jgi:hypothetical protein
MHSKGTSLRQVAPATALLGAPLVQAAAAEFSFLVAQEGQALALGTNSSQ